MLIRESVGVRYVQSRYKSQGKQEQALKLCEEALEARRKIYQGDEHSDVAVSMYTMGAILLDTQSYSKAETLLRDSVALLDKLCGPSGSGDSGSGNAADQTSASPSQSRTAQLLLATAKNNLALCLKSKGAYEEAEELYREVLNNRANMPGVQAPRALQGGECKGLSQLPRAEAALAWTLFSSLLFCFFLSLLSVPADMQYRGHHSHCWPKVL
eukprot:COSAG02_NODE_692_length_18432_cov_12.452681_11_plen_213_part_00